MSLPPVGLAPVTRLRIPAIPSCIPSALSCRGGAFRPYLPTDPEIGAAVTTGGVQMSEANKEIIRRLYREVMGEGRMDVADEIFHPDYVDHMPIMETPDRAGLLKSVEAARRAFPEVEPRIIAEIAEGEWVAIAVEADGGPHEGEYMGVPPTGRPVHWTETHFWRIEDGRIIEHHGNVSMFEIHRMIGAHDLQTTLG